MQKIKILFITLLGCLLFPLLVHAEGRNEIGRSMDTFQSTSNEVSRTTIIYEDVYESEVTEPDPELLIEGKIYRLKEIEYEEIYTTRTEDKTVTDTIFSSNPNSDIPFSKTINGNSYHLVNNSGFTLTGTEIVTEQKVENTVVTLNVPDNDMERVPKNEGDKVLVGVEFTPLEWDSAGIPTAYTAYCNYAKVVKNQYEVPAEYTATAIYQTTLSYEVLDRTIARSTYENIELVPLPKPEPEPESEPEPEPEPELQVEPKPVNNTGKIITAATSGTTFFVVVFWIRSSVPVYCLTIEKRYKLIGRAKLKKGKTYDVFIKDKLLNKMDTPVGAVKFSKLRLLVGKDKLVIVNFGNDKTKNHIAEMVTFHR